MGGVGFPPTLSVFLAWFLRRQITLAISTAGLTYSFMPANNFSRDDFLRHACLQKATSEGRGPRCVCVYLCSNGASKIKHPEGKIFAKLLTFHVFFLLDQWLSKIPKPQHNPWRIIFIFCKLYHPALTLTILDLFSWSAFFFFKSTLFNPLLLSHCSSSESYFKTAWPFALSLSLPLSNRWSSAPRERLQSPSSCMLGFVGPPPSGCRMHIN